jgi:hypothetical protein
MQLPNTRQRTCQKLPDRPSTPVHYSRQPQLQFVSEQRQASFAQPQEQLPQSQVPQQLLKVSLLLSVPFSVLFIVFLLFVERILALHWG